MQHALLHRTTHRPRSGLEILPEVTLDFIRVHEACGRSRRSFAMMVASKIDGPIFWLSLEWEKDQLFPTGMADFCKPQNFTFLTPRRPEDVLWCMEEILRSGTVPLVVADLPDMPGLTPVRRLHLAAETGVKEGLTKPLGLLLTPGTGGAQGVESRWQMEPAHSGANHEWALTRLRARTAPHKHWALHGQPGQTTLSPATNNTSHQQTVAM